MKYVSLAVRNLTRQKIRSILLGGVIAFGLFFMFLISSASAGIKSNFYNNIADLIAGEIFITRFEKDNADDRIREIIRSDEEIMGFINESGIDIEHIHKRSDLSAYLIFEGKTERSRIDGVDWEDETQLEDCTLNQ